MKYQDGQYTRAVTISFSQRSILWIIVWVGLFTSNIFILMGILGLMGAYIFGDDPFGNSLFPMIVFGSGVMSTVLIWCIFLTDR